MNRKLYGNIELLTDSGGGGNSRVGVLFAKKTGVCGRGGGSIICYVGIKKKKPCAARAR